MDELAKLQLANHKVSGFGVYEVKTHFPCPFCGAEDWCVVKIIDFRGESKPHKCEVCGRSARFVHEESAGSVSVGVVQTGGPAQPSWLKPRMPVELPTIMEAAGDGAGEYAWVRRDAILDTPEKAVEEYRDYMGLDGEEMPAPEQAKPIFMRPATDADEPEEGIAVVCGEGEMDSQPYWEIDLSP
jgi:predicted RNA-binding Zn-ribbon protein involved in translation (DUF1610 family)